MDTSKGKNSLGLSLLAILGLDGNGRSIVAASGYLEDETRSTFVGTLCNLLTTLYSKDTLAKIKWVVTDESKQGNKNTRPTAL